MELSELAVLNSIWPCSGECHGSKSYTLISLPLPEILFTIIVKTVKEHVH